MTEITLAIGATVYWGDGTPGQVESLVVGRGDSSAWRVTHLVVKPQRGPGLARIVPQDRVERADAKTGELSLGCTDDGFAGLPAAEEIAAEVTLGGPPDTTVLQIDNLVDDALPGEDEEYGGERVHATDGDIGHLHALSVDHDTGIVTLVRLKKHLWGHKELAIPIDKVSGFDAGIQLNITKHEAQHLTA
jgi:hypothetical protein